MGCFGWVRQTSQQVPSVDGRETSWAGPGGHHTLLVSMLPHHSSCNATGHPVTMCQTHKASGRCHVGSEEDISQSSVFFPFWKACTALCKDEVWHAYGGSSSRRVIFTAVAQGCGGPIKEWHLEPTPPAIFSNGVSNSVCSQEGQLKKAGRCWLYDAVYFRSALSWSS